MTRRGQGEAEVEDVQREQSTVSSIIGTETSRSTKINLTRSTAFLRHYQRAAESEWIDTVDHAPFQNKMSANVMRLPLERRVRSFPLARLRHVMTTRSKSARMNPALDRIGPASGVIKYIAPSEGSAPAATHICAP